MVLCAVSGCSNSWKNNSKRAGVSFFRFPREATLCAEWVRLCGRPEGFRVRHARVCSDHFQEVDMEGSLMHRLLHYRPQRARRVRPDARPSLGLPFGHSPVQEAQDLPESSTEHQESPNLLQEPPSTSELVQETLQLSEVQNTASVGQETRDGRETSTQCLELGRLFERSQETGRVTLGSQQMPKRTKEKCKTSRNTKRPEVMHQTQKRRPLREKGARWLVRAMEKENGEGDKGGPDAANLLDAALFAYWPRGDTGSAAGSSSLFGGIPSGFGNHLGASSYMMGGGRSGSASSYGHQQVPTTGSYGSLGTLSVAASQAASLGINPASAAWWTMASHLAAQDYLARLQASAAASGIQFGGLPESLVPGYPGMLPTPHTSHHSGKMSSSKSSKYTSGSKAHTTTTMSMQMPCLAGSGGAPSSRDRERDKDREQREREQKRERELIREAREAIASTQPNAAHQPSNIASILGGVRLPPDTEIIKYTSSIVGPKVPGTTNRGRKKTISLDPPSVSVMPSLSSTGLPIDRNRGRNRARHSGDPADYRSENATNSLDRDRVEVIKLPAHSSNGTAALNIPSFGSSQFSTSAGESDAPLNLSLKPTSLTSVVPSTPLQALALSASTTPHDRISRRKGGSGGPRPRRVPPTVTSIPASPSPSLAQLFAAADSPRPSSGSEENDSTHHKDGRPRNLGRGVSKPKKNTVASLLAQSRALGIKPVQGLELSPLNHQVSLLKSNILAAQQQLAVNKERDGNDDERQSNEDRERSSPASSEDRHKRPSMTSSRTEGVTITNSRPSELMNLAAASNALSISSLSSALSLKDIVSSTLSESSTGDVSSDSVSDDSDSEDDLSESGSKRDGDETGLQKSVYNQFHKLKCSKKQEKNYAACGPPVKRRKTEVGLRELRVPLEHGWRRETIITGVSGVGVIRGEVSYISPCGRKFKQISDVVRYLEKQNVTDMNRENFSYTAKVLLGDYMQPTGSDEMMRLTEEQVLKRLDELKLVRGLHRLDSSRHTQDQKHLAAVEREKIAQARRQAKEDAAKQKEQSRLLKEQDKCLRQEALRREREQRNQQMLEARRRRHEELEKQRQEDHARKQQERERRRQHMALVKALESRKRLEERERKRQELRAEKIASKERKMEQRRLELELVRELRKPAEDMELSEQKPLPTLNRIPGLKLSGQAFADTLMVFEFLHNFGETLGFDMESLPSLNSLQMALLNDEEAEEELLSVMTHLLVCAIEDPGIPNPARHTTILGQSLKQADITHTNLSEILRIYLYANATGEVKALTGLHFERDREKKSDHHNSFTDVQSPVACGKNAAFFEHLHENFTWQMSEWLSRRPFLALNPTHKAAILAFLCNELLQNKAVLRQIDASIESAGQLRKDRWLYDTRMRKLRMLHSRRVRQVATSTIAKLETSGCEESSDADKKETVEEEDEVEEDEDNDSAPESDTGTQPEEEEDKNLSPEELGRKLDKVSKQYESAIQGLSQSSQQLRATCLGQDRYWRRYWALPCTGAVFVEAMESSNPNIFRTEEGDKLSEEPTSPKKVDNPDITTEVVKSEEAEVKDENNKDTISESEKEIKNEVSESNSNDSGVQNGDSEVKLDQSEKIEEPVVEGMSSESKNVEKEPTEDEDMKNEESRLDEEMGEDRSGDSSTEVDDNDKCEPMDVGDEKKTEDSARESYDVENEHRKRRTRQPLNNDVEMEEIKDNGIEQLDVIDNLLPKDKPVESDIDSKDNIKSELVTDDKVKAEESKAASETSDSDSRFVMEEDKVTPKQEITETDVNEKPVVPCETDAEDDKSNVKTNEEKIKTEDALSSVKVEIKSDLFGAELKAAKSEAVEEKPFHRPFDCVEKESVEMPTITTNGDKFNALNHLYSLGTTAFHHSKELNGGFLLGTGSNERNWFSILPRDACDSTSVTNNNSSISRFPEGCSASELRIPVFPPPSRLSSPSPGGSQCESPGPLVLTPDEMVQLEYMKKSGGVMKPQPVKPVPPELRRGWWRITDQDQLRTILNNLHSRGFRESQLKRILTKYMDHTLESCGRLNIVRSGDKAATDLAITDMDHKVSALPGGAPLVDKDEEWDHDVALRVDMFMLEQVESMEDKVANASMQVKGWKVPPRATAEEGVVFRPACLPETDDGRRNPIEIAKDRLISLEAAIERRYLKPPLGISMGDLSLQGMQGEVVLDDALPKGLVTWREAVARAQTAAQLAMTLYMLEASVAWDKSIMKANCQFCHSGDNEDKLLLCDGCDKGYHTYCFKPKMENIPDGDWYCYECMNKATGERNCIVCGKKSTGKNLVLCDLCPRAYHCDCLQVPLVKVPRGKWYCPTCSSKQPRKRGAHRRSKPRDTSESSDHIPASPTPTVATDDTQSAASPDPTPPPARKERGSKKLLKDLKPCIALMEDLEAHDEAWPFLLPVNTKQFPTYRKIIKNPMDLSTIKKKLLDTGYKGREEFCMDVRQIFNNCETFNEDDSPVGKAGHSMRLFFEARWTEINANHPKTATP